MMQLTALFIFFNLIFSNLSLYLCQGSSLFEEELPEKHIRETLNTSCMEVNQWNTLPDELYMQIFDYLSFSNLSIAQQVCKQWNRVAKDEVFSPLYIILKRPLKVLSAKVGLHEKSFKGIRKEIDNCIQDTFLCEAFYRSPDAIYKALHTPSAISQVLQEPKLGPLIFESSITAKQIYFALGKKNLDKKLQDAIEKYTKCMPITSYKGKLFSKELVNFTDLYHPYLKAFFLLSLFRPPSNDPLFNLLDQVFAELNSLHTYSSEYEPQVLYVPQALVKLEIPSVNSYDIGLFCHRWTKPNTNQAYKEQWQAYEVFFLRQAAIEGLAKAQFKVAKLLHKKGIVSEAESFYRQAVNQGEIKARFYLGRFLLEQKKYSPAEEVFNPSSILDSPEAQFMLGRTLLLQEGFKEAEKAYMQAAAQGYIKAHYEWREKKKFQEAKKFLLNAARQHHLKAQYELARLFYWQEKMKQACFWYHIAATRGHKDSQYELGLLMFRYGKNQEAERFLEQAASQGHTLSCFELGYFLFKKGNVAAAEEYFCKVAKQADGNKLYQLSQLLLQNADPRAFNLFHSQIAKHASHDALCKFKEMENSNS